MRGHKSRRTGLWRWLHLSIATHRMGELTKAGVSPDVIKIGQQFQARWKGNARFYALLVDAHWGLSHWPEVIRYGRMALALNQRLVTTVKFMLSAYRSLDRARGVAFGEAWLARNGVEADVCRHLSMLHDDLGRPADALDVARRGLTRAPNNRRLAGCAANYLAKVEGAASALRFAETHRHLFAGDTYCQNALANGLVAARAHREAAEIFAELHRRNPRDSAIFGSLLEAWFNCGRHRETIAAVEDWQEGKVITAPLANEAGRACVELARKEEALFWMKRAMDLAPDSAKYADNYAITLGRVGRYAEGIEAAQRRLAAPGSPDRRRLLKSIAVDHTFLGQYTEALPYYQKVFAEFPDDADSVVDVIIGLTWLKRYDEAADFGLRFRETRGATLPARYWSQLAWSLNQCGRFSLEEEVVRDWLRLHRDDALAVRAMKRALNALDRRADALAFVRTWVEAHPTNAWGWRYLAEQQELGGDAEAEVAALAEACRLAPDEVDFVDTRLSTLRRLKRAQEALDLGRAWAEARPDRVTAALLNRIGLSADDFERWPVAEDYYRQAHGLQPANGTWIGNLVRAVILQNRAAEAVALGRRWLAENSWDNYLAGKLAWALREAKLFGEETELLRKIIAADSSDTGLHPVLLTSLLAQKRTEEAREWVEHCLAGRTATSGMCNDLGNHLRQVERLVDAEAAYQKSLELKPDNDTAAGNLSALLVHAGRELEAIRLCRDWLERSPDDHYVRRQLANACYLADDFVVAESAYRNLSAREPETVFLRERWVACLRLLGRYDEALTEAQRWTQQHPATAFLLVEMGIAADRLKRVDEALAHYDAALQLEPAARAAASRKVRLLGDQHELVRALEFGEQWRTTHAAAADGDFHNELGILQDRAGRTDAAEQSFRKAVELDPNNATFVGNAVEILARRDRLEESIQLGQRLLANSPPNAYLLRRLAESYAAHHDYEPALDLLTTADALEPGDVEVARAFLRLASDGGELPRGVDFGRAWVARAGNEKHAAVWASFSRLCFRADHDDEAFAALRRAEELEPDEIAHVRLRLSFRNALGASRAVVDEYHEVRRDWQDDTHLLRLASRAYHELGMATEALELATRDLAINPADHDACAWLADLHDRCGRTDAADDCLHRWINVHGEQPAVLKVRARLLLRGEKFAEALADAEKVLGHRADDEESFVIAMRALRGLERGPEAKARLHHWVEHHGCSSRIERLLDESP